MKLLLSIFWSFLFIASLLLHRYVIGAPFPPIEIIFLTYAATTLGIQLALYEKEELEILRWGIFIGAIFTLVLSIVFKGVLISVPGANLWVNGMTIILMGGFILSYVKEFALQAYNNFTNRHNLK